MPQTLGRTRPSIYLVAACGHPNYGDELIAATWLKRLARLAPDSDVWVGCSNPGSSAVLLGDLHPRVRFTDTFWRLCWEAPSQEPWEVATFVQRAIKDPGVAPRWLVGIELAARMDIVHVVGGGFINGLWPRHVGLLAASVAAAGRSGGRAVMTGQSLWPVAHGAETLVRELAAQFDLVDVPDQPSAQLLSTVGAVSLTGDDMFLGIEPQLYRRGDVPEVMLCLQGDLLDGTTSGLASFVMETLRDWGVRAGQVGVVEGIPGVDRRVFDLMEQMLPGARFYPFSEVLAEGLPAAAGQLWVSTRFHMHLMAAAAGASGLAVSVNAGYYTNKHRSLIDLGSGWALSEGLTPVVRPGHGGFTEEVLGSLKARKAEVAASVYGHHHAQALQVAATGREATAPTAAQTIASPPWWKAMAFATRRGAGDPLQKELDRARAETGYPSRPRHRQGA